MNTTNSFALILISFGIFFLFGKPAISDISMLRAEKQEYSVAIEQINSLESKKSELLAKLNNLPAEDRERLETFLPTKDGVIRLIADIDGIASKHGISMNSADLSQAKTDLARSVALPAGAKAYNSRIIDISFAATYEDLNEFLSDLEKSLRTIDIRSIDFASSAIGAANQYRISLEVYWLKDLKYETVQIK